MSSSSLIPSTISEVYRLKSLVESLFEIAGQEVHQIDEVKNRLSYTLENLKRNVAEIEKGRVP
jgi:hypothetical protein